MTPLAPTLADVMPSAASLLGVPGTVDTLGLAALAPAPRAVVVVLVDGLGLHLLEDRSGHAPYLRSLLGRAGGVAPGLAAGFPTTTAASLASLGTGLPPGRHGILGYDVYDPAGDRVVNQLAWPADLDPAAWQPRATVFERAVAAGVDVVRVGPRAFHGSGLTAAALRGGAYAAAETLPDRVAAAARHAAASQRLLAYVYWGDLDRTGHDRGCRSLEWTRQLEDVDAALAGLARRLPPGSLLVVTADHGMLDVAPSGRVDLRDRPDLTRGVRRIAGEPRAVYLWPDPGSGDDVAERWRTGLGEGVEVVTRAQAAAGGWFGPDPDARLLDRAGELVAVLRTPQVVLDAARLRPDVLRLIGWHGGLTAAEVAVPLLVDAL